MKTLKRTPEPSVVGPVHPNQGIQAEYRRRLERLIGQMHNSVLYWLSAAYKANPPRMAQDDAPAVILRRIMRALAKRWQARFDELAPDLAAYFATHVSRRADGALTAILAKHGFSVRLRATPLTRDVWQATTGENVALIKSIPQRYFTDIETQVMRSAAAGRDLEALTDYLGPKVDLARIGLGRRAGETGTSLAARTMRRAQLIARDQNNKATATRIRVRQSEL